MGRVDLIRQNLSWILLLFAGLVVLFWLRGELAPAVWEAPSGMRMPLGFWLDRGAELFPLWVRNLVAVLIVFWNGLVLSRIISRNMILLERTYLPFLLYLLLACGYRFGGGSLVPFFVAALTAASCDLMIDSFRRGTNYVRSFDSALLLGLCVLLYAPAVALAPLLLCGLVIFKKNWREWVTSFTGLLLPFVMAAYVCWGLGHPFSYLWTLFRDILIGRIAAPAFPALFATPPVCVFAGVGVVLILLGLFVALTPRHNVRARPRKAALYLIWALLFSAVPLVAPGATPDDLVVAGVPVSVMMTIALNRFGGWFSNAACLLLLGGVILHNLIALLH